jgi:multimeric flavodoxin WrbA
MLIVGLQGSPRKNGNCDLLVNAALESAREAGAKVLKLQLSDLVIHLCQACNECLESGECVQKDDMVQVYRALEEADGLIVCSPIWFSGLSSQTKVLFDRCQCLWARGEVLHRPLAGGKPRLGAFISVGGDEKVVFRNALSESRAFFSALGYHPMEELLFAGVERKGSIREHPTALGQARELGRKMVGEIRSLGSAGESPV